MTDTTITVEMDNPTKRFYQGVAAGNKVEEAHADFPYDDHQTRVNLFWFYVGALAAEQGCTTEEDFSHFILGANTRAPRRDDSPCRDHPPGDVCPGYEGCEDDPNVPESCKAKYAEKEV